MQKAEQDRQKRIRMQKKTKRLGHKENYKAKGTAAKVKRYSENNGNQKSVCTEKQHEVVKQTK